MATPDPKKAIHLKPGRRTLRRGQKKEETEAGGWERHRGDAALDPWGTALRDMRAAGTWPDDGG